MHMQDHVAELAGQCEAMLPRLAALAEQVTDEVTHDTLSARVLQLWQQLRLASDVSARQPALDCSCGHARRLICRRR